MARRLREDDWFITLSGRKVHLLDPQPDDILLEDVAGTLARICRFGGMISRHYSVAQHSVLVSRLCRLENAKIGLLHDAAEAYLGDVISPLKRLLGPTYRHLELLWESAIAIRFGLRPEDFWTKPDDVRQADQTAYATEHRDLRPDLDRHDGMVEPDPGRIVPRPPSIACIEFIERWVELWGVKDLDPGRLAS
jgi:hypothetical protein